MFLGLPFFFKKPEPLMSSAVKKVALVSALMLLVAAAVAAALAPSMAKSAIEQRLAQIQGAEVQIEGVRWAGLRSWRITGFSARVEPAEALSPAPEGVAPQAQGLHLVEAKALDVTLHPIASLTRGRWSVSGELVGARAESAVGPRGQRSLKAFRETLELGYEKFVERMQGAPDFHIISFRAEAFEVTLTEIRDDPSQRIEIRRGHLTVQDFSNDPEQPPGRAKVTLGAEALGGSFELNATLSPVSAPFMAQVQLGVESIEIAEPGALINGFERLALHEATLSLSAERALQQPWRLKLSGNLDGLKLQGAFALASDEGDDAEPPPSDARREEQRDTPMASWPDLSVSAFTVSQTDLDLELGTEQDPWPIKAQGLNLTVAHIETRPERASRPIEIGLEAKTWGGTLSAEAKLEPYARRVAIDLKGESLDLNPLGRRLSMASWHTEELTSSGVISWAERPIEISISEMTHTRPRVALNPSAMGSTSSGGPALSIDRLVVQGGRFDLLGVLEGEDVVLSQVDATVLDWHTRSVKDSTPAKLKLSASVLGGHVDMAAQFKQLERADRSATLNAAWRALEVETLHPLYAEFTELRAEQGRSDGSMEVSLQGSRYDGVALMRVSDLKIKRAVSPSGEKRRGGFLARLGVQAGIELAEGLGQEKLSLRAPFSGELGGRMHVDIKSALSSLRAPLDVDAKAPPSP